MAITGTWSQRLSIQAGARQWGTGVNPVHSVRTGNGRNTAPGGSEPVDSSLTGVEDYGYMPEDTASTLYGYGWQTGVADYPNLSDHQFRGSSKDFPQWGRRQGGLPGGAVIRSQNHGADLTYTPRDPMLHDAYAGWDNKLTGDVNDAETSDPSQYTMNTSMTQRDKTLSGSQRSGSQSEYVAPIRSRIPGMKIKPLTGDSHRHMDMLPKEQTWTIRPWWNRSAGTGPTSMLKTNAAAETMPLTRNPPPDPYQGPTLTGDAGYTSEDPIYG